LQRTLEFQDATRAVEAARQVFANADLPAAEQICKTVLPKAPDTGGVWAVLTETALARGRLDAALVSAKRAIALLPGDPIAHILQAKCLFLSGEAGDALAAAERASKIVGASPESLDALGAILVCWASTSGRSIYVAGPWRRGQMFRNTSSISPRPNG
jgi:predicted Zn-dependent protease